LFEKAMEQYQGFSGKRGNSLSIHRDRKAG